jgi:hypothetical protein
VPVVEVEVVDDVLFTLTARPTGSSIIFGLELEFRGLLEGML